MTLRPAVSCALAVFLLCYGSATAQDTLLFYTWARPEVMDDFRPVFAKFEAETGLKWRFKGLPVV